MKTRLTVTGLLVAISLVSCSRETAGPPEGVVVPAVQPAQLSPEISGATAAASPEPGHRVFYGDLHIHTSLSTDAFVMGVRTLPDDVYTYARGGSIEHGAGYRISNPRPLDFVAVTDHAEFLGQARQAGLDVPTTARPLEELIAAHDPGVLTRAWVETTGFIRDKGFGFGVDRADPDINRSAWQMTIDSAERHNEPGVFTAFIGYEYSAFAGSSSVHIHRNVIYRGSEVSPRPFTYLDSQRPQDLWRFLESETAAGRAAFAIPHNANLSDGNMYRAVDSEGESIGAEYARLRSRYEPISEILQVKGQSETHPLLSPDDPFAGFEQASLVAAQERPALEGVKGGFARDALRLGLELSRREGFNPYAFGVIGSSDSHNASSPVDESDYHGKLPMMDGSPGLRTSAALRIPAAMNPATRWGSGGLAGVWAEQNTRAALYDAMARKETFATSGPRISVRLFGGWEYGDALLENPDPASLARAAGVPMGGRLSAAPAGGAPAFLVMAMKDPQGANLDRLQIVKGWVDEAGASRERIYNVAASDGRLPDADGALPAVGNTVNVAEASYSNSIGAPSLDAVWRDPDFDPALEAFYYARVLEIPTPRWSTYDAKVLGMEPLQPAAIRERAITSAIWYSP